MLEFAGAQGGFPAFTLGQIFPDGVGLVAVGDDQPLPHLPDGVVDNQAGVHHFAGVKGLGADAVRLPDKDPVAAVDAAAHDEVGGNGFFAVGGYTQHNAPAGVGVAGEPLGHGFDFVDVHLVSSFMDAQTVSAAWGSRIHSACSITRRCSVSGVSPGSI